MDRVSVTTHKQVFSAAELSLFAYQLSLVLKSGMPYLEGLKLFVDEIAQPKLKAAALLIYENVKGGKKLYESMAAVGSFPTYFVQMTQIAETAGHLDEEMARLSQFYDQSDRLTADIRQALIYPLILLGLMAAVIGLMILKVFPVFQEVLESLGGDIPAATAGLFDLSLSVQRYGAIVVGVLVVALLGVYFYTKTTQGEHHFDRVKLTWPLFKQLYQKLISARFAKAFSMMLKAGLPVEEALALASPVVGNLYAQSRLNVSSEALTAGRPLVDALKEGEIFPTFFLNMLNVGVKTGETESMLDRLTEIYELELSRFLKTLSSTIEPVLVLVLSIIVGVILLTVMLPLISIMASIG